MTPEAVLPDYGGACIASVVPALLDRAGRAPTWLPAPAVGASQVVLLVIDGLGWEQLRDREHVAPVLAGMVGGPITSVAPSTTATALTSIATGAAPNAHGLLGYRIRVGDGIGEVLNILRWRTPSGDARATVPPEELMALEGFGGANPPVVTGARFGGTGFTVAAFRAGRFVGYHSPSGIAVEVGRQLAGGEPFVYAYHDTLDFVAHACGLDDRYDAELRAADRIVADVLAVLPPGAALVVTADHGQVDVGDRVVPLADAVLADCDLISGEARFRWLHARPGTAGRLLDNARANHGDVAWVRSRKEVEAEGWLGGPIPGELTSRIGDVAIAAFEPVAIVDPREDEPRLRSRHGSLTSAEMLVPLVAARA